MASSLRHWNLIAQVVDRFNRAWDNGEIPAIEDYLPSAPEPDDLRRRAVMCELVMIDLERRWWDPAIRLAGEDYLNRYPELRLLPEFPAKLLQHEIAVRQQQVTPTKLAEHRSRSPGQWEQLTASLVAQAPSDGLREHSGPTSRVVCPHCGRRLAIVPTAESSHCPGCGELLDTGCTSSSLATNVPQPAGGVRHKSIPEFSGGPFAQLPEFMQHEVRRRMSFVDFPDGATLFAENSPGDCLLLIVRGRVGVWARKLRKRLGSVKAGQVAGEMALMGSPLRTADAVAEGPVAALQLDGDDFASLCGLYPEIAHVVTHVIADRLGRTDHDAFCAKTLRGYTIRQRLGRGGMAVVYDAEHAELGRRVALKMMSHRLVFDRHSSEQFRQESQIIGQFEHPHIPRLYECFEGFGTTFMALEFVEGQTLAELLDTLGPLPERVCMPILQQLAEALRFAHRAGIVHRDVKPSNVMITPVGTVMLLDFGLAIRWRNVGRPTSVGGTIAYMPPEQFLSQLPRPAADWFSFGCVAFELITGERLLRREDILRGTQYDDWSVDEIIGRVPAQCRRIREILAATLRFDAAERQPVAASFFDDPQAPPAPGWNAT